MIASSFNQDIWAAASRKGCYDASAFNQDGDWEVHSDGMRLLFNGATAFDQDLGWCLDEGVNFVTVRLWHLVRVESAAIPVRRRAKWHQLRRRRRIPDRWLRPRVSSAQCLGPRKEEGEAPPSPRKLRSRRDLRCPEDPRRRCLDACRRLKETLATKKGERLLSVNGKLVTPMTARGESMLAAAADAAGPDSRQSALEEATAPKETEAEPTPLSRLKSPVDSAPRAWRASPVRTRAAASAEPLPAARRARAGTRMRHCAVRVPIIEEAESSSAPRRPSPARAAGAPVSFAFALRSRTTPTTPLTKAAGRSTHAPRVSSVETSKHLSSPAKARSRCFPRNLFRASQRWPTMNCANLEISSKAATTPTANTSSAAYDVLHLARNI